MKTIDLDSGLWTKALVQGVARVDMTKYVDTVAAEAAKILPSNFDFLNIQLEPVSSEYVIPETGVMGMTYDAMHLSIWFDPNVPYGVSEAKKSIRGTVFHEMVHATTFEHDAWRPDALFGAVSEGLATVFERDYSEVDPLWGKYENEATMRMWYEELKSLPQSDVKDRSYFVEHSDGRKWIVYKTGTWMIDNLLGSGTDLFELMGLDYDDIVRKFEATL